MAHPKARMALALNPVARLVLAVATALAACSGSDSPGDAAVVHGDVPIAYVKRAAAVGLNPTDGANFAPGGDLLLREKSSPSAAEHNLTAAITQGQGDVSDPEVSYDGRRIVFALRCPSRNTSTVDGQPACTDRWNIWEYDMGAIGSGSLLGGRLRRLTHSSSADDVDPVYLPGRRGIVFSSNRQAKSSLDQALGRAYFAADEYERERVMNLHSMAADGSGVQQISFNMSHERNPVVRPNGDLMFARWEHVAERNRFAIFRAKPDGTDLFVLYGAHSPGNSYLHPRDMDPKGRHAGQLVSSLMPLSGTQEGGSLQLIDAARYSEFNTPASRSVPASGGQQAATERTLSEGRGLSLFGRATTPYPLWDGSDRILVAWRPCEVTRNGVVVSCQTLTDDEKARLASNRSMAARTADAVQDNAPSAYAIYMFNPANQTWLVVAAPPPGFMFTDPVALSPRTEPTVVEPTTVDAALAARNRALIEVRSVFDTDGLNRMAAPMLVASDLPAGCSTAIPQAAPHEAGDTRSSVADLARLRDPAQPAYRCNPAWFVRATRGVPPPSGMGGSRQAIGETEFEQNQILGYAPIEPDGSFKLEVPADVPLALSVIDADGRAIQTHTNWIQVRPGERRTCDGCHSPRRGAALNSGPVVASLPAGIKRSWAAAHTPGETLASLRTRLDPAALALATHPVFTDVWVDAAEPGAGGVQPRRSLSLRYRGNPDPADDLATPEPVAGVINYPEHIQPLWTRPRGPAGQHTCVACHAEPNRLDLRATLAGSGRLVSYERLLLGSPLIDPATGRPVVVLRDGVPEVVFGPALVNTSSGAAGTAGQARKSRLTELMWGQTLLAGLDARSAYPTPSATPPATAPDHAQLLNRAEKRLLAEWMDLGGQYYNDPFDASGGVRRVEGLSQATFVAQVQPVLRAQCASCHQAGGGNARNRFVLTGSPEGDFNVTLSFIANTCAPERNPVLALPSTVPHPRGELLQTTALLPPGSSGFEAIASWMRAGCTVPAPARPR